MQIAEFFERIVLSAGSPSPHPVLYHYTTFSGGLNILSSQEFWSTAHDCTNDEAELVSANSIVAEVAQACRQKHTTGTAAEVLDVFLAHYPGSMITQMRTIYLSCFSVAKDDESQWREYGDCGRGLCLGIRILEEPAPKSADIVSITLEVDYSETSLRDWLADVFEKSCQLLARVEPSYISRAAGLSALYRIAAFASIRAKRKKWKNEQEVRQVTFTRRNAGVEVKKRTSTTGRVVRYLPVSLRANGKLIAFDEIIIGANQDTQEVQRQLESLLAAKGYAVGSVEYPRITVSSIPSFS
jgi:trehalose-6-phosphatase